MKVHHTRLSLVLIVYLPLAALYCLLYLFEYQQLLAFRTVHWVFLGLALGLLVSPQRKRRVESEHERLPWPKWLLGVTGFVSVLGGFFYFSQLFLGQVLTIDKPSLASLPTYFQLSQESGLFPWALVALFAIALQRVYHDRDHSGHFSHCLQPIFNTSTHSPIGEYCNAYIRYTLFVSLSMPLMFIGLAGLSLYMHFSQTLLPAGINILSMFCALLLAYVMTYTQWPLFFNWLIKYRCPTLLSLLIILCSGMALLVLLLELIPRLTHPTLVNHVYFNPAAWPLFWDIVNVLLTLSWIPLASTTIAVLSRGYEMWKIIAATLFIPSLVLAINQIVSAHPTSEPLQDPTMIAIALIVCSMLLLMIFLNPSILATVWRGLYPVATKQSKPIVFLRSLLTAAIALIGIFWVTGFYILTLILTAFTLSSILLIMMTVGHWVREKVEQKSLILISRLDPFPDE